MLYFVLHLPQQHKLAHSVNSDPARAIPDTLHRPTCLAAVRSRVDGGLFRTKQGAIDYSHDFFGKAAFLTVSGQLQAEYYATALSNVYTFAPTFRAEGEQRCSYCSAGICCWLLQGHLSAAPNYSVPISGQAAVQMGTPNCNVVFLVFCSKAVLCHVCLLLSVTCKHGCFLV